MVLQSGTGDTEEMAGTVHHGQCPVFLLLLHVYSVREDRSEANVHSTSFHFSLPLQASKHQFTSWDCWVPGSAPLAGAAACQELRLFDATQPQPSPEGSISSSSTAGMRCQPVSSLICLESSLVPALFASSHGNRQASEKVFHPLILPDNSLEPASVCLQAQLLAASWDLFLMNCC